MNTHGLTMLGFHVGLTTGNDGRGRKSWHRIRNRLWSIDGLSAGVALCVFLVVLALFVRAM